jgi:hypothetical protein
MGRHGTGMDPRLEEALRRDALPALVLGREGLAFANPWLDTPTDPVAVLSAWRAAFGDDPRAMRRFAEALVTAAAEPDDGWVVMYCLPDLLDDAASFGADFDAPACAAAILARIRAHAAHLATLRRWCGAADPAGCLGVVERYVATLRAAYPAALGSVPW